MSKQENLISADKLLEWLEDNIVAHIILRDPTDRVYSYKNVADEVREGKFNLDPVVSTKQELPLYIIEQFNDQQSTLNFNGDNYLIKQKVISVEKI